MSVYQSKIDRRTALKWISVAMASATISTQARAKTYIKTPNGYGTDPNLVNPSAPWERIMSKKQLQLTATLTDIILPAEQPHPAASTVGVPDFINEWVSSPYDQTKKDKSIIMKGLVWVETEAKHRFGQPFELCTSGQQIAIMQTMATVSNNPEHKFFLCFKRLTLGGYYTTPAGFKDIGYIGNVPLKTYPGPSVEQVNKLEKSMKGLGI